MSPETTPGFAEELRTELEDRLHQRDRAGAVELALDAVHNGRISVANLYTQVLSPLLAAIGSAWQHGQERVWEEHLASHAISTIVEALYPDVVKAAATVPSLGRSALLACPPAERHELGLRMLADRFALAGWDVTYLGGDVPIAEIVSAAQTVRADLVALSVSTVFERVELRRFIDTLRTELPDARIVVGGPAFACDRDWPAEDLLDPSELGLPGAPREG
jgi:MerR family transcriptional regulator, light-induced transcriptional regulator